MTKEDKDNTPNPDRKKMAAAKALLEEGIPDRVLEVGTGSGYQSAVLARLVPKVYTVERIQPLLAAARECHRAMGLRNVFTRHSDGSWGLPELAPWPARLPNAPARPTREALVAHEVRVGRAVVAAATAVAAVTAAATVTAVVRLGRVT